MTTIEDLKEEIVRLETDNANLYVVVQKLKEEVKQGGGEMKLTKEQITSFKEAAMPLMQWLNENCHPHCTVIVDSERAEVMEGLAAVMREPIQKEGAGVSLIERLKEGCAWHPKRWSGDCGEYSRVDELETDKLLLSAAERIEKLENALRRISSLDFAQSGSAQDRMGRAQQVAMEALK